MRLTIFNFDGTITTKDNFENFIFYSHGVLRTLGVSWLSTRYWFYMP